MEFGYGRRRFSASSSSTQNNNTATTSIHHINFGGATIETTVTKDAATITRWVTKILSLHKGKKIVGLDIEWKPNHSKYTNNRAATLQLCIHNKCLIIQLIYLNSTPRSLKSFMSQNPDVIFVGVEVAKDVAMLEMEYGLWCHKIKDLREAAETNGAIMGNNRCPGLKNLAFQIVGFIMEKPKYVTLSDW